jgi:hypothetical protein
MFLWSAFPATCAFEMNLVESFVLKKAKDKLLGHNAAAGEHVANAAGTAVALLGHSTPGILDKATKVTQGVSQIFGLLMMIIRYKKMLMPSLPAASAAVSGSMSQVATSADVSMNSLWKMLRGSDSEAEIRQEIEAEPESGLITLKKLESLMAQNLPANINELAGRLYVLAQSRKNDLFFSEKK